MRKLLSLLAVGTALTLTACGGSSDGNQVGRHIHHAQVYTSGSDTYASTYDPTLDLITWYILTTPTASPGATTTSTWSRSTTPPASPTAVTGKSVEFNDKGEPEGEPEDTPEGEEVVDEDTTPDEAQEQTDTENADADQAAEDSSTDASSSDGGDSSSDSGGGDGGGGE